MTADDSLKIQLDHITAKGSRQCSPRSSSNYSFVVVNCWQAIYTRDSSANNTNLHRVNHNGKRYGKR